VYLNENKPEKIEIPCFSSLFYSFSGNSRVFAKSAARAASAR
jgi:hypothetical protein